MGGEGAGGACGRRAPATAGCPRFFSPEPRCDPPARQPGSELLLDEGLDPPQLGLLVGALREASSSRSFTVFVWLLSTVLLSRPCGYCCFCVAREGCSSPGLFVGHGDRLSASSCPSTTSSAGRHWPSPVAPAPGAGRISCAAARFRHLVNPKQLRPSVGRHVTEAMRPDESGTGLRGAEVGDLGRIARARASQFLMFLRAWSRLMCRAWVRKRRFRHKFFASRHE